MTEHVVVQGVHVPSLGLGTWQLSGSKCQAAVEAAIAIGYRHIDTAQMYGNEAEVGRAVEASGVDPGELFVTTKIDNGSHAPDAVRASTEASLRALRVPAIDLLLVHHPVDLDILESTLTAMGALRDEGIVRHLGVSNFSLPLLDRALAAAPLLAIQIEYHPFRRQDDQLAAARRHGLLFQAYSPLARGAVSADADLGRIAGGVGATPAQVALRWLIDQSNVAAIPKAALRAHLEENWSVLDLRLGRETRDAVDVLSYRNQDAASVAG